MPLLLLLPLLLIVLLALWALLLPLALWQRYRLGKARRRLVAWVARLNVWLLLLSTSVYLASAWVLGYWIEAALTYALAGLATGWVVGLAGLALTRFEHEPHGLFYTPNRLLVLALTLVVAARIVYGVVRAWQAWQAEADSTWLLHQGSVVAVAGLPLGYYLAYAWGLRRRLPRV